ncbi:hypothetical protein SAMN04487820_111188 [Actinopolyspora mzabensis]|uniref:2-phosphosulfolactate phosphatase n=1 Tax=Actinopolyspora mzabensis TaxID=995066 RepID=A0A1G9E8J5_ACTMZ|nr:hypothetical protein [Actinopolyspora mzabensis]SDK72452.1 hypothetical protein SAMN04487820_111188 [Actinopolyspora mzabensis]
MPYEQAAAPAAQAAHTVRFDWGTAGLRSLGEECAALVVVDVLSFTTAVDVITLPGCYGEDVELALARNASSTAPRLQAGVFSHH